MYSHSDEELTRVDKLFDHIVSYHSQSDYTYDYKLKYKKKATSTHSVDYAANKSRTALWYAMNSVLCSA